MSSGPAAPLLRPVAGVDIDGVLAAWHELFLRFAVDYLGRPMPKVYHGTGPLHREMGITKASYREVKLAFRQSGLKRAMKTRPGAVELCHDIRRNGGELWVCTTRPYLRLDNIDPDTREWLRRNRIRVDGVIYGDSKYRDLARLVGTERVVGVIDDEPPMVRQAEKAGLPARLILREYNREETGLDYYRDLQEARLCIVDRIRDWVEQR